MKIENWKLSEIKPYRHNAKMHNVEWIANSIKNFKPDQPIVVDKNGVIIKGHGRLSAAKKLGLKTFPVVVRDDLTAKQANLSRLADNKVADAGLDAIQLDLAIQELDLDEIGDKIADMGIDELIADIEKTGLKDIDAVDTKEDLKTIDKARQKTKKNIKRRVKAVFNAVDVTVFEEALIATGIKNRAQALVKVCQFYLDHKGGENAIIS